MGKVIIDLKDSKRVYDINGEDFSLPLSDGKLQEYVESFAKMSKLEPKELEFKNLRTQIIKLLDGIFPDEGERFYKACGESSFVVINAVNQIIVDMSETLRQEKGKRLEDYLAK